MKELRIDAQLRNNILYHAIFDMWDSVDAFCHDSGISNIMVGKLLNLKCNPLKRGTGRGDTSSLTREYRKEDSFAIQLVLKRKETK